MQETSLRESICYTESADEKPQNMRPNNQLCTEKSGGHCASFEAMLRSLQTAL